MSDSHRYSNGQQFTNGCVNKSDKEAPRVVRKRARISVPMPILSPREERLAKESRRLIRRYGTRQNHTSVETN